MADFDAKDTWEALFDRVWLRWFDLLEQPALVEIVKVERVELTMRGGIKSKKGAAYLNLVTGAIELSKSEERPGNIKGLVLNNTNARTIAEIYGPKPSQWIGKQIVLFVTTTRMWNAETKRNEEVPCIRIRAKKEQAQEAANGKKS
jgi:hypothetical protein